MNLISGVYHLCERREHVFMIFREYTIISRARLVIVSDDYTCNIYIYISISYKNRKGGGGGGRERLISKN